MRALLVVASFIGGLVAVAAVATGGFSLASRFVIADANLESYAAALVPDGATVTASVGDQCTESGWTGALTLKDTCYRLIWTRPGVDMARQKHDVLLLADSAGWELTRDSGRTILLARPGYIGAVLLLSDDEIANCKSNDKMPGYSPDFCGNSIEMLRDRV